MVTNVFAGRELMVRAYDSCNGHRYYPKLWIRGEAVTGAARLIEPAGLDERFDRSHRGCEAPTLDFRNVVAA
jgi:hypothetical protein